MTCASCASVIEYGLKKEKGINSVSVNLASEKAFLDFDSTKITKQDIEKAIKDLGYRVVVGENNNNETKKLRNRFILSLVFGLPVIYMVMGKMIGLPLPAFFEKYGLYVQAVLSAVVILTCFNIWKSGFKKLS